MQNIFFKNVLCPTDRVHIVASRFPPTQPDRSMAEIPSDFKRSEVAPPRSWLPLLTYACAQDALG